MDAGGIFGLAFVLGVAAIVFFAVEGRDARLKKEAANAPPPPREVVTIVERSQMTGSGQFGGVLLAITLLASLVILVSAKTVFGEIEAALVLIAGTLLSGLALLLGRARSYVVYRTPRLAPSTPPTREAPRDHSRLASIERLSKVQR